MPYLTVLAPSTTHCILIAVVKNANSSARKGGRSGSPQHSEPSTTGVSASTGLAIEGAGRIPLRLAPSKKAGPERAGIVVELSKAQVDQIVCEAGQAGSTMSVLLSAIGGPDWVLAFDSERWPPQELENPRLSRSLLLGLVVLSCFAAAEKELGVADVVGMLQLNNSTAHRYMSTLLAVGLLQQDPDGVPVM